VPTTDDVLTLYTQAGGQITTDYSFGMDPLAANGILLRRREEQFTQSNPSFIEIYNKVINGNSWLMKQAIISFISITKIISRT